MDQKEETEETRATDRTSRRRLANTWSWLRKRRWTEVIQAWSTFAIALVTCYTIFGTTLGDRLLDELRSKATATEEELKRNAEIAQKVTLAAVWRLGDERLRDYGHIALFATKFHDHQGWVLEVEDINRKLERASSQETGSGPEDTAVKDLSEALRKLSPPMFWLDLPDHESGGIMGHPVHEDPVWRAYQKSVNEAWPYMRRGSLSTYERHLEFRRHVETVFLPSCLKVRDVRSDQPGGIHKFDQGPSAG